jgi:tetratricopeptide (TPR) repeat protein
MTRFLTLALLACLGVCAQHRSGADLYNSGQYAQAVEVLEAELRSGSASVETRFWLGYAYLALRARDQAAEHFQAYLKDRPRDEDVLYALARTYAQLAEMSLQQIFRLDPRSARAYQMRGIRFELEKSWTEALEQYALAAKLDPSLPQIHASIGRIQRQELNDPEAARLAYAEELKRFPASREANEFFAGGPGKIGASRILAACYPRVKPTCPAPRKMDRVYYVTFLLAQDRPAEALEILLPWRGQEPSNTDVYYLLGEAFTDLKVKTIRQLKAVNPESFRLHHLLAESYASTHQKAEAIREYREVLRLAPRTPGVNYELARLLADTTPADAVELLLAELGVDGDNYLAKSLLGRLYVVLQKPDAAIPILKEALAARANLMDARKALGQSYAALGQYESALAEYDHVVNSDPRDEQIHFLRAQALSSLGFDEEAQKAREKHAAVLKEIRDAARQP